MPLMQTERLTKLFQRGGETIFALRETSLTIDQNEYVSIIGPSGSGKSTLMYILGLIDSPTSGSYHLAGVDTASLNDDQRADLRNRQLGFVFQSFHLLPLASAQRNVAMPLVYSGKMSSAEINERAVDALERVGLGDRLNHVPGELSGGQRQRVAIARALINQPSIIFADEPTGNLDSRSGAEIISLFEELHVAGKTIILVTHDNQIASRALRKIELHDGSVLKDSHAL